eukprot:CAMPEP_0175706190 /NCGR_PEP_ID=MMETSP0097-20121207/37919_1 /TAXON_ID=311494 /ORGANISM="Alexandrium monilatum, Strain CCMP3105" /LENGTH=67 /DNA_ID=CAMNT_0017013531 /DNA_START=23 /DNA_END=223 /DNA_ORIENTATION=-
MSSALLRLMAGKPALRAAPAAFLRSSSSDSSSLSVEGREPSEDPDGVEPKVVLKSDSSENTLVITME